MTVSALYLNFPPKLVATQSNSSQSSKNRFTKLKVAKSLNNQLVFSTVNPHLPVIGYATNLPY